MRQDQLQQARLTRWRQDGNALLTLDDAERWLADTPLCLYLPRQQHLPVPAPSFVEAIAGRPDATPGPEAIAAAAQMLARLVASGAVIALNLFGAAPGIGVSSFVGEHPDFLATPEALPYLYALQPERNPKREPSTAGNSRVSPLAAEAWKLLEREGALTTIELRSHLGREVTEAAVLRSLAELWHTMRVVPVPADNPEKGAHWELLSARHLRELNIGSTQSQTTALSILASFYLQSAVAASAEEVEIFLSPVASRSRIRDVVHGLSTTRQLGSFPLHGEGQLYVEGSLPEIEEEETVVLAAGAIAGVDAGSLDAGLEQNEPDLTEAAAPNPESITRHRPAPLRRAPRPAFGDRARGSFAARDRRTPSTGRPPRREGGFRPPQRSESGTSDRGSFRPRAEGNEGTAAEGASRPSRPSFERRARPGFAGSDRSARFDRGGRGAPRSSSSDKPRASFEKRSGDFEKRSGGPGQRSGGPDKRRSFDKGRPARPASGGFRPEKSFRDKPFADRPPRSGEGTERPRFRPAAGAASSQSRPPRPGSPRSGPPRFGQDRPGRPPRDGDRPTRSFGGEGRGASRPDRPFRKPQGDRPAGGPRRFGGRPAAAGGFSRPRRDGESRPPFRDGQSRPPFRGGQSRPQGDRPFKRPYSSAGDRPPRGPADSYGKSGGSDRPPRKFTPRPRPESGAPEGGELESRPFRPAGQRPSRPGGFSKPAFGKRSFDKPGGYRKPAGDRPAAAGEGLAAGGDRPDRPRPPRPAFGSGPRKPGGFRKSASAGKPFGKPRSAGAGSRGPGPAGAGPGGSGGAKKNRTSTTTSSGKPRRPGAFGKSARPPAKGGFKSGGFKPGGKRPGAKAPGTKAPGGFTPPRRKPRGESREGDQG
jgi:hypothetical protein